jgi:hypothetical protein
MKRTLLITSVLLAVVACATFLKPSAPVVGKLVTIHAQSLPIMRTVAWDANPASDNVTMYVVRLDGVVVGAAVTGTTHPITITAAGPHTVAVRAVNLWGESPDAVLNFNVVVPGAPSGLRFQ